MTLTVMQNVLVSTSPKVAPRHTMLKMEPKMSEFSSLFQRLPLLKLIFKLDIWFQHGKFTMNSHYPKVGDRHFKVQLPSQGFIISFLLDHSLTALNSLWSSVHSKLPKNILISLHDT